MTEEAKSISVDVLVSQCLPRFQEISRTNGNLVKWEQESQFALQSLQKSERLTQCVPHTIENAIINVAASGLTLNPADGYAYLVPEYNTQTKQNECQLRISFKGLIKAATDSGVIEWVKAEVVHEADTFTYKGVSQEPEHSMNPFSKERGEPVGVYCLAKTAKGDFLCDVMSWEEVMKIKGAAKTDMVWKQWPMEMAKKAIIKRAAKQWPKSAGSSALHETIQILNNNEGSDPLGNLSEKAEEILQIIESPGEQGFDVHGFGEIWDELDEREIAGIWTAKTKGGFFSQQEKDVIRSLVSEWGKIKAETIEGDSEPVQEEG